MSGEPRNARAGISREIENESAESLEKSGEQYNKVWRGQQLRDIRIGIYLAVGMIASLIVLDQIDAIHVSHDIVETIIYSPTNGFVLLAICVGFLAFLGGMGVIIFGIIAIIKGPPKAGKTPQSTIQQFYTYALATRAQLESMPRVEAFVCILDRAKREVGEWQGFQDYWKSTNRDIVSSLRLLCEDHLTETNYSLVRVRLQNEDENYASYQADIDFYVISGITSPGVSSAKKFGPYPHSVEGDIFRVGDRWYLLSGKWNGILREGNADNASATKS